MKNILVTGGSRGIGKAIVELFSESGYNVAFTYKNSADTALELTKKHGAYAICCDLEDEESILRCVKNVRSYFGGGVDILINNAAISQIKMVTDISSEDWHTMIAVNLTAPFLFSRELLPDMISKKQGRIINISSMWGQVGASCEVAYSAAKAGLIGMTRAMAKELGPSNITVNAIAPGVIDTEMNAHLTRGEREMLCDEIPLMRFGEAQEVAKLVLYLASHDSGYITGQVIGLNGGMVV